jgi:Xaa-Pro dipeptidase
MLAKLFADHLKVVRARTDRALRQHGFDSLAIFAGRAPMQFLDDQSYPFKANPHFKSWVPLTDAAECWLLYRPGERPTLLFYQPEDYWHQPGALPEDFWTSEFQIEVIREPIDAKPYLAKIRDGAFVGEWQKEFKEWTSLHVNPPAFIEQLHFARASKTPYELECMREASTLGVRGHKAAENAFRRGASEFDIHAEYMRAVQQGEHELPYSNIVGLNRHSAVLHYQHQERRPPDRLLSFLIDAGASCRGYASDITRTYSYDSGEFSALITRMDSLQRELCSEVRPGVDYVDIHLSAHRKIARALRDAGLIRAEADNAVESGVTSVFFPHGVGHLIGLQVHDVSGFAIDETGAQRARPAGHPFLRLTRKLEPGFVVTIEPGIYFIDMLLREARNKPIGNDINWNRVEALHPYGGIRIEDDVVCTEGAPENLTRAAFAAAQ